MTCYRSRDNWHSYVKNSLSEAERDEMASHLSNCPECRSIVAIIQETLESLAKNQVILCPPLDIKINVMKAIDKHRYRENIVSTNPFHLFELKNWGVSMIAAGILLFALNLTTLNPGSENGQMTELHTELGKQFTIPFDKMSQVANDALEKIESLSLSK
ncbi:anti-sigma factor family protein [Desulfosporosinus nitroreducens]|uniref:Anti-sigma-W factor RsiW n=1 Tax=Desulfosporosinus nitroreducens TaxID=2018668 RepID=A0ABT8QLX4_9FIRM|nr:zf-HC2 domain-containing protein [Desulfosporosinus nitroreducens]MCO1600773.1 zf-HC2 domain-containing protein [Desulfosporosinus nitroreducens]MDO0822260.1 zf-HC2 domain-containing protein [Desulfosporosinus nitroreducens]